MRFSIAIRFDILSLCVALSFAYLLTITKDFWYFLRGEFTIYFNVEDIYLSIHIYITVNTLNK